MNLKHRILSTIAAGTIVLGTGLVGAPAGAVPDGPDDIAPCTENCGPGPDWGGPDDLANPTADPGDGDDPIPADATFTG